MIRIAALMTVAALGLAAGAAIAEDRVPDATVKLTGGSIAAGVGVEWGSGTVTYHGKDYPISVKGLSVGGVGATSIDASGKVYNLKKLEDINGKYTTLNTGVTAAQGVGVTAMSNPNGVTIELVSTTQGVALSLGGGGVEMSIQK